MNQKQKEIEFEAISSILEELHPIFDVQARFYDQETKERIGIKFTCGEEIFAILVPSACGYNISDAIGSKKPLKEYTPVRRKKNEWYQINSVDTMIPALRIGKGLANAVNAVIYHTIREKSHVFKEIEAKGQQPSESIF